MSCGCCGAYGLNIEVTREEKSVAICDAAILGDDGGSYRKKITVYTAPIRRRNTDDPCVGDGGFDLTGDLATLTVTDTWTGTISAPDADACLAADPSEVTSVDVLEGDSGQSCGCGLADGQLCNAPPTTVESVTYEDEVTQEDIDAGASEWAEIGTRSGVGLTTVLPDDAGRAYLGIPGPFQAITWSNPSDPFASPADWLLSSASASPDSIIPAPEDELHGWHRVRATAVITRGGGVMMPLIIRVIATTIDPDLIATVVETDVAFPVGLTEIEIELPDPAFGEVTTWTFEAKVGVIAE